MKKAKSKGAVKPQPDIPAAESSLKAVEARAKLAKERARQARARLKQARKASRQTKKIAKLERKKLVQAEKAFRKLIRKAEKSAVRKLIKPAKEIAPAKAVKPHARKRRSFVVRARPVVMKEPPVVETTQDSAPSMGVPAEGGFTVQ